MSSVARALIQASRPKTLTASVVPVMVGVALAYHDTSKIDFHLLALILLSGGSIQIGTNFANDAIDFLKGADTGRRIGPARAVQQGWMTAETMLLLAGGCFLLALMFGIPLVIVGGWPILTIGLVSLLMGYCYTGGPYPLAYKGLGDIFVLIFFGWIAVGGTYYLMTGSWNLPAFVAGTQVGLLGVLLIAVNNLRDREQDSACGKRTLSVRLGRLAHWEVTALIFITFALSFFWFRLGVWKAALFPLAILPLAWRLDIALKSTPAGPVYNQYLATAAKIQLCFGGLISLGFCLS